MSSSSSKANNTNTHRSTDINDTPSQQNSHFNNNYNNYNNHSDSNNHDGMDSNINHTNNNINNNINDHGHVNNENPSENENHLDNQNILHQLEDGLLNSVNQSVARTNEVLNSLIPVVSVLFNRLGQITSSHTTHSSSEYSSSPYFSEKSSLLAAYPENTITLELSSNLDHRIASCINVLCQSVLTSERLRHFFMSTDFSHHPLFSQKLVCLIQSMNKLRLLCPISLHPYKIHEEAVKINQDQQFLRSRQTGAFIPDPLQDHELFHLLIRQVLQTSDYMFKELCWISCPYCHELCLDSSFSESNAYKEFLTLDLEKEYDDFASVPQYPQPPSSSRTGPELPSLSTEATTNPPLSIPLQHALDQRRKNQKFLSQCRCHSSIRPPTMVKIHSLAMELSHLLWIHVKSPSPASIPLLKRRKSISSTSSNFSTQSTADTNPSSSTNSQAQSTLHPQGIKRKKPSHPSTSNSPYFTIPTSWTLSLNSFSSHLTAIAKSPFSIQTDYKIKSIIFKDIHSNYFYWAFNQNDLVHVILNDRIERCEQLSMEHERNIFMILCEMSPNF